MDILIVANFCSDFSNKGNNRFRYLAELLSKDKNNEVEILTSSFAHGAKAQKEPVHVEGYNVTLVYEPGYKKNVEFKRFFSHYVWGKNVKKYLKTRKKPDVIYCAVPSITGPYYVSRYCKKNNIRFIIDIQDLWPEAFQMVFNVPIVKDIVFAPFKFFVNKVYKQADQICAVSQTYVDRALQVNKKCSTGTCVFLGTRLETFDENAKTNAILQKGKNEIWLAYCGTLGKSYDIKCVLDALEIVSSKYNNIRLIIMGDGPDRKCLEEYAVGKKLNAIFTGLLAYQSMCALLTECDIAINPIVDTSVASIINKHADYAASGLPVINTQNSKEYKDLVEGYNMGLNILDTASRMAEAIIYMIENPDIRLEMGRNARKCAEEKFNRSNSYKKLETVIQLWEGGGVSFKPSNEIWIGYCGTLGSSYDLKCVIDALKIINRNDLRFVIIGNGPRYDEFVEYAKEKNVSCLFTGWVPYPKMCGILVACDIVVNPITKGAAQSIINKHADYAASGKPVINTQECNEYRKLIKEYNMGVNCISNNAIDMADKISFVLSNQNILTQMGQNSRKCAIELFDREKTYQKIVENIENGK